MGPVRKWLLCFGFIFTAFNAGSGASAYGAERVNLTLIIAHDEGSDMDLDNDAYRDELIRLFSYRSYQQVDQSLLMLEQGRTETLSLPGGYELSLALEGVENTRYYLHAAIRKGGMVYVDAVLSILKPGVAFLGGPPAEKGDLIIVIEMGF